MVTDTARCPRCGALLSSEEGRQTPLCSSCGADLTRAAPTTRPERSATLEDSSLNASVLAQWAALQWLQEQRQTKQSQMDYLQENADRYSLALANLMTKKASVPRKKAVGIVVGCGMVLTGVCAVAIGGAPGTNSLWCLGPALFVLAVGIGIVAKSLRANTGALDVRQEQVRQGLAEIEGQIAFLAEDLQWIGQETARLNAKMQRLVGRL